MTSKDMSKIKLPAFLYNSPQTWWYILNPSSAHIRSKAPQRSKTTWWRPFQLTSPVRSCTSWVSPWRKQQTTTPGSTCWKAHCSRGTHPPTMSASVPSAHRNLSNPVRSPLLYVTPYKHVSRLTSTLKNTSSISLSTCSWPCCLHQLGHSVWQWRLPSSWSCWHLRIMSIVNWQWQQLWWPSIPNLTSTWPVLWRSADP